MEEDARVREVRGGEEKVGMRGMEGEGEEVR